MGRLAAKVVVAAALADAAPGDWPLGAIEIPSDPNGAPYARLAPERGGAAGFTPCERLPISVSLSHAEGYALAAAAWARAGGGRAGPALGIDLGLVEPRSGAFLATFFTEEERRFVREGPPSGRDLRANLVWCAKEAVLKALGLGLAADTFDVSCAPGDALADPAEWPLAPPDAGWRSFVATCRGALAPGGGPLRGIWRSFPGFVGALAARVPLESADPCSPHEPSLRLTPATAAA